MKARFTKTSAAIIVAAFSASALAFANWTFLGQRAVSDHADHDTIAVTGQRGRFEAIKLTVHGHAVRFKKVVVRFGNNTKEEIELRNVIPAGGESRVIDLPGGDRVIKSVDFWYEAKSVGSGGATVKLFGKR